MTAAWLGACSSNAGPAHRAVPAAQHSASAGSPAATSAPASGSSASVVVSSQPQPSAAGSVAAISGAGQCGVVMQMAQNTRQPADIIFGVDTTGSMAEEIGFTEQNMNAFSQQISAAGIDVHVILISGLKDGMPDVPVHIDGVCIDAPLGSGKCPEDSRPPGYAHVAHALADWDILQGYIDDYPMYKQYLRESSFKTFVSISDGDIAGNPILQQPINSADKFIDAVSQLDPHSSMWMNWRYSAIYSFSACGVGNDVGVVHEELVKRTHGVAGDLCLQDFKPVFDDLAKQVAEVVSLACDWEIPASPRGETFDPNKTNVQLTIAGTAEQLGKAPSVVDCGAREGWHYDSEAAPQRVVACPATCTRIQSAHDAQVSVLFGCETVVLAPD